MKAMVLHKLVSLREDPEPLAWREVAAPQPGAGEVLLKVSVCGVCHTEVDEIEGRTPPPRLPVIPGHQVVGRVAGRGLGADAYRDGERLGVAWIYATDETCEYCRSGRENLCPSFGATGRDADGGYAEYMVVREDFAHPIPEALGDAHAAPLLCAGAVGYRSLRLARLADGQRLGLTGFGASGHLVLQMARYRYPACEIYVFSRNAVERDFARTLGASWAGSIGEQPPHKLDAIIDTTPVWKPVVEALAALAPGGRLVINAIRKEDVDKGELLRLDYGAHLWMEREIISVANVTRRDVREGLALAAEMGLQPEVQEFPLEEANRALLEVRLGQIRGAKVLRVR